MWHLTYIIFIPVIVGVEIKVSFYGDGNKSQTTLQRALITVSVYMSQLSTVVQSSRDKEKPPCGCTLSLPSVYVL